MLLGKRVSIARSNPNRNKKDNSHSDGQREHGRLMDLYHSLLHVFALGHACVCGHIILCQFHLLIKCCVCVWQCCTFVLISFVSPNCCSPQIAFLYQMLQWRKSLMLKMDLHGSMPFCLSTMPFWDDPRCLCTLKSQKDTHS